MPGYTSLAVRGEGQEGGSEAVPAAKRVKAGELGDTGGPALPLPFTGHLGSFQNAAGWRGRWVDGVGVTLSRLRRGGDWEAAGLGRRWVTPSPGLGRGGTSVVLMEAVVGRQGCSTKSIN